jgi:twitching motility protein PilT
VLALEVLVPNAAVRNLIREDKVHQIYSSMQTGQAQFGMQTMNQSLFDLYQKRHITYDDAIGRSTVPEEMLTMLHQGNSMQDGGEQMRRRPSKVKY